MRKTTGWHWNSKSRYQIDHRKIRRRRCALDISATEASKRAGFKNRQRWTSIENGERLQQGGATINVVEQIAQALSCSIWDVMKPDNRAMPEYPSKIHNNKIISPDSPPGASDVL